jgi:hypothetical protein
MEDVMGTDWQTADLPEWDVEEQVRGLQGVGAAAAAAVTRNK